MGAPSASSEPRPHVLILGGFLTVPLNYWPLRRRLMARGAASVRIAPIGIVDWLAAGVRGFGPLLSTAERAIAEAHGGAGGRPILVIGHSAGGIVARLALSPEPYRGRVGADPEMVGALVTLGTPHGLGAMRVRVPHAGHHASRFLDRVAPGAHHAPVTGYLTVGARSRVPAPPSRRRPWTRALAIGYGLLLGEVRGAVAEPLVGDGVVPVATVHLEGAEQLTFDDVTHGHLGGPWYGDDRVVDRWWPAAVALWRSSVELRDARAEGLGLGPAEGSVSF